MIYAMITEKSLVVTNSGLLSKIVFTISNGLFQGTVCAPTLFNLYKDGFNLFNINANEPKAAVQLRTEPKKKLSSKDKIKVTLHKKSIINAPAKEIKKDPSSNEKNMPCHSIAFADDLVVLVVGKNTIQIQNKLQEKVNNINHLFEM